MAIIVQTDFAWPDDRVEREVIEAAGHRLICGSSSPADAPAIAALVAAHDPQAIMTCWAEVGAAAVAAPTDLRIVQRIGVGLDNIDVAAASRRGAWVANVPDYCIEEVSDHAVALLLDWARGTVAFDRAVKAGRWDPAGAQLRRVADLTVGIIGYGRIGRRSAEKLAAFGCRLLAHSRTAIAAAGCEQVSLDSLLGASDVVILHAPYTPETHHLIDASRLAAMKSGALLINVSRGGLVANDAVLAALVEGRLSGAALDVIEGEPDPPHALIDRPDVIVTPHVAFSSGASLIELRRRAAEEVVRVLAGAAPLNPCNQPKGFS